MVHINQKFLSLATATFLGLLGLLHGMGLGTGNPIEIASFELGPSAGWMLVGVMFVLAYFHIVHLSD
jgi:hypothetical protein